MMVDGERPCNFAIAHHTVPYLACTAKHDDDGETVASLSRSPKREVSGTNMLLPSAISAIQAIDRPQKRTCDAMQDANSGWHPAHVVQETVTGAFDGERPPWLGVWSDRASGFSSGIAEEPPEERGTEAVNSSTVDTRFSGLSALGRSCSCSSLLPFPFTHGH